jgi:hypothetical protein
VHWKSLRWQSFSGYEALTAERRGINLCIRMEGKARRKSLGSHRLNRIDKSYLLSLSQSILPRGVVFAQLT